MVENAFQQKISVANTIEITPTIEIIIAIVVKNVCVVFFELAIFWFEEE